MSRIAENFSMLVPHRPFATDNYAAGTWRCTRREALRCRYIQPNPPTACTWLVLDIDREDAYFAADEANVSPPNFVAVNRDNGHAHYGYLMHNPVATHSAARLKPLKWLAGIQRGLTRRLRADRGYSGNLIKNPLHRDWAVHWRRDRPYELREFENYLEFHDKRHWPTVKEESGYGRNCALFDELRRIAYSDVREFWNHHSGGERLREHLLATANGLNGSFVSPLSTSELRSISRSTAKWVWKHFSRERFSEIQRQRILKRWRGHEAASKSKPWATQGISRATYYRNKRNGGHG